MPSLLAFARSIDALNRLVGRAVAWLLAIMVLVGSYNAIARYLQPDVEVRISSNALIELQWYLFSLVFLLGAPYALRRNEHVRVDVLYSGLPARGRHWIDFLGMAVMMIPFCVFAVWASWEFAAKSIAQGEMSNDPGGLPRYPLKAVVPVAFALLGLQGVSEAIKRLALLRGATEAEVGLSEGEGQA